MPIKTTNLHDDSIDFNIDKDIEGVNIEIDFHGSDIKKDLLNFNIKVKFESEIEDKEFSDKFKEIVGLRFSPYNYKTNTYNYYTSKYTDPSKTFRLNILKSLLEESTKQVLINKENDIKSKEYFEKEFTNLNSFQTDDLFCVPIKSEESIFAIPKRFLDTDGFSKYRKLSSDFRKSITLPIEISEKLKLEAPDFFKPSSSVFIIDKARLYGFMSTINEEILSKEHFVKDQVKIGENENLSQYDITNKNPFDLKIKYNGNEGYFEFYCKGYIDSFSPFGDLAPKSALGRLALNHILLTTDKNVPDISEHWDIKVEDACKVNFKFLASSSARVKKLHIPAEQFERVKIIYENYQNIKGLFEREVDQIKIPFRSLSVEAASDNYPFVFFKDDGTASLIYNVRHSNINSKSNFMTLKGISLSKEEVNEFLFNHPLSKDILEGTKIVLVGMSQSTTISEKIKDDMFQKAYEVYNLRNELNINTKPTRKMKI